MRPARSLRGRCPGVVWDGSDLLPGMAVVGVGPPEPPRTVSGAVWDGSDLLPGMAWLVLVLGEE